MRHPILILLERHWDTEPQKALMEALPFLKKYGYDTLCYEQFSDYNEEEIHDHYKKRVKDSENLLSHIAQCFTKAGICGDPSTMDFRELLDLLESIGIQNHIDLTYALAITVPGTNQSLKTINKAKDLGIKIFGIDLPEKQLNCETNFSSMDTMISGSALKNLNEQREISFSQNLLRLRQQGKNIIFVVGQAHFKGLVKNLSKEIHANEVVFLHPYFNKNLDRNDTAFDFQLSSLDEVDTIPTIMEQEINKEGDRGLFVNALKEALKVIKIQKSSVLESTMHYDKSSIELTNISLQVLGGFMAVVGCLTVATAITLLNAATFGAVGLVVASLGIASILAGTGLFATGTYENKQLTSKEVLVIQNP